MDPHIVHLNHPQQDALLLGGVVVVLVATFFLTGGQQLDEGDAVAVANGSDAVQELLGDRRYRFSIERGTDGVHSVIYRAVNGSRRVTVRVAANRSVLSAVAAGDD